MAITPTDGVSGLQTPLKAKIELTESGKELKAPENIVLEVSGAIQVYNRLREAALKRIRLFGAIDGLIAGKPPFDPEELEAAGLDYIANINMMDAESLYARSCQAYWNLTHLAKHHFVVNYRTGSPEDARISEILSRNLHEVITSWPSYSKLKSYNASQIVKYGLSVITWPDERSWKWRVIDTDKFYVPDQTQSDIEQLTTVCIDTDITIQKLWHVYTEFKDKKDNTANPWNIDELEFLLLRLSGVDDKTQAADKNIADFERRFYAGDSQLATKYSDSVSLVSYFQVEYSGKVTQMIFHPKIHNGKFLYREKDQYPTINHGLLFYSASPGEKTIHSNRGVGQKIFTSAQAIMRIDNAILDTTRIASTPLLSGPAGGSSDAQGMRMYPGVATYIGSAKFEQNGFGTNINQLVGASQYFTGKQNNNLGNSGDDPAQKDKAAGGISAEQFTFNKLDEFGILKNVILHYYETEDFLAQNIVGKMLKSTKSDPDYAYFERWKDLCILEGVPEEIFVLDKRKTTAGADIWILPPKWSAKATRVVGDGSSTAALMSLEKFASLVTQLPAKGVARFNRDVAINTVGPDHVTAYLGDEEPDESAGGASLAAMENFAMRQGESPVFSPNNEHRPMFVTHMALAMDTISKVRQQEIDAVAADNIFNVLIPHNDLHFNTLMQGTFDKRFAMQQEDNWNQVKKFAGENRGNAAKIKQAALKQKVADQEATQTVMSDAERKDFVVQKDEARKDFVITSKENRTEKAEETRGQILNNKVVLDHQNKTLATVLDHKNEKTKIVLDHHNNETDTVLHNAVEVKKADLEHLREVIHNDQGKTPAPNDIE